MTREIQSAILKHYQHMVINLNKQNMLSKLIFGKKKLVSIMIKQFEGGVPINQWSIVPDAIQEVPVDSDDTIPNGSFRLEGEIVYITHRLGILNGGTNCYEITENPDGVQLINKQAVMNT